MKTLLSIIFVVSLYFLVFKIPASYRKRKRIEKCEELLKIINDMLNKNEYQEILDKINKEKVLRYQYRLPPELRKRVMEIEVECLEKLGRIEEAVISLASHLDSTYEINEWPQDLYTKWLRLYKSIEPLPIQKFYFCECCGFHPDTKRLLDSAIEKGCKPPIGYPGECKSAVVVHLGPKKARQK